MQRNVARRQRKQWRRSDTLWGRKCIEHVCQASRKHTTSTMSNNESEHNYVYMQTPQGILNSYSCLVLCISKLKEQEKRWGCCHGSRVDCQPPLILFWFLFLIFTHTHTHSVYWAYFPERSLKCLRSAFFLLISTLTAFYVLQQMYSSHCRVFLFF